MAGFIPPKVSDVGEEVVESRLHGEIFKISGTRMNTIATDNWPEVFKKLLLECPPRVAVLLLSEGKRIAPDFSADDESANGCSWVSVLCRDVWPPVDLSVPLQLYIQAPPDHPLGDERRFLRNDRPPRHSFPQAAKRRRLHTKFPKEYITAPLGVLEMTRHDSGWRLVTCRGCQAITFAHTASWNGWRRDDALEPVLCSTCGLDPGDPYIGDCGRCELAMFRSDDVERVHEGPDGVWCWMCFHIFRFPIRDCERVHPDL